MDHFISPDTHPAQDILGRNAFAAQIVNSLTLFFGEQKESLVVGISGKWGSGKSTLLHYVKQHLDSHHSHNPKGYKILSFNSWGHTAGDDLERSFLEKVVETLSKMDWKDKAVKANSKFRKYLEYLDYVKFAGHFHPVIKNMLEGAEDYRKKVEMVSLDEVRLEANQLLEQNGTRLYILIDDLDRLTPTEVTTLFRILKVNLNLSNTIFLVAYDKRVVTQALQREYGVDGEQYLEKIIQVDFHIPQVSEVQIEGLFFDRMSVLLSKIGCPFNATAFRSVWKIHGLKEFFRSVRDLNRYFNNLIFSLPNIAGEVNLFDFLVLDAIKTFDAQTYHQIYSDIIEIHRKGIWERISLDISFINKYEKETTRALLDYLFSRQYSNDGSGNKKRLRNREYFERYFALSVPPKVTEYDQLEHFFLKDTNKGVVLASALNSGKMEKLLGELSKECIADSFSLDDRNIFRDFIDFFRSAPEPQDIDSGILIARAYFNLVRLFKDRHKATAAAAAPLLLEKDKSNRIGFMFKHFLVQDPDLLHLPKELSRYVELNADRLRDNLLVYLLGHCSVELNTISTDRANWIDNLFLVDLMKEDPDAYLHELGERMYPKIIWFIVANNLFVFEDGKLSGIIEEDVKLYFPGDVLAEVIVRIRHTLPGQLRDNEFKELGYFQFCVERMQSAPKKNKR